MDTKVDELLAQMSQLAENCRALSDAVQSAKAGEATRQKTIVVYRLPRSAGLLYSRLSDLTLLPQLQSSYVFEHEMFEVVNVLELLGCRPDGSRKSSTEQLLELVAALSSDNPHAALAQVASMRNIGAAEEKRSDKSPAGLIVNLSAGLFRDIERVVLLDLKSVRHLPRLDEDALLKGELDGSGQKRGARAAAKSG